VPGEDSTSVDTISLRGCEAYSTVQTDHHTDEGFPCWRVLLILRAATHTITVHDGAVTICPQLGDLVLFDLLILAANGLAKRGRRRGSRPKRMRVLCSAFVFVCRHLDLDVRPSREEAKRQLCDLPLPVLTVRVKAPR
jgi:hypothetical protein